MIPQLQFLRYKECWKKQQIKITWLDSQELTSSFCYSSIRSGEQLKAVSIEVMSFQSVSKSLVQTPSLLGHSDLPPTPIKKKRKEKEKEKKLNQIIRMRCFDFSKLHSRLCAELSGSNPSTMVSNTKHTGKMLSSHSENKY